MSATASIPTGQSFVKASAIAKLYSVTVPTVYLWARTGKIPSVTFESTVRFDLEQVRAVIEGKGGQA